MQRRIVILLQKEYCTLQVVSRFEITIAYWVELLRKIFRLIILSADISLEEFANESKEKGIFWPCPDLDLAFAGTQTLFSPTRSSTPNCLTSTRQYGAPAGVHPRMMNDSIFFYNLTHWKSGQPGAFLQQGPSERIGALVDQYR